jgi:hypothetical protein
MTISSDLFVKWTVGLGLAEADLDFLQWAIEDRIEEEKLDLEKYYPGLEEWNQRYLDKWRQELDSMMTQFLEEEHYEKCARVQEIRQKLGI